MEAVGLDADGGGIGEISPAEHAGALDPALGVLVGQETDLTGTGERLAREGHRWRDGSALAPVDQVHGREHRLALLLGQRRRGTAVHVGDVVTTRGGGRGAAGSGGEGGDKSRQGEARDLLHGELLGRRGGVGG